jgi:hypothetical protein
LIQIIYVFFAMFAVLIFKHATRSLDGTADIVKQFPKHTRRNQAAITEPWKLQFSDQSDFKDALTRPDLPKPGFNTRVPSPAVRQENKTITKLAWHCRKEALRIYRCCP